MSLFCFSPAWNLRELLSKWKRFVGMALLVWCVQMPAFADVWGYIDAKGVAHFAAEKLDDRYELFFKGATSFDTREGIAGASKPAPEIETPRSAGLPARQSKLLAFFEVSPSFKAVKHHMRDAARAHNVDFELLQALIATESGFDPSAVSPKGAVGLMQLIPPTAQRYGVRGDANTPIEKKLTDPKTNIQAGTRYLRDLINMFPGKLELALAAYNAGEGAVQRYGNKIPPFKETQNYVVTVMQIYSQLKPPAAIAQRQEQRQEPRVQPDRVRMAFETRPLGAMAGRSNMVPPLTAAAPAPLDPSDDSNR